MRAIYGASVFAGLMMLAAIAEDPISAQPFNK